MKKLLIILTFLFVLNSNFIVYAEGACSIKSWPSESLAKYINDLQKVLTELKKDALSYNCWNWVQWTFDSAYGGIISDGNKAFNFDWYLSSWDFNLSPIFTWDVPSEFYRDHDYVQKQSKKINDLAKILSKKCALDKPFVSTIIKDKQIEYGISEVVKIGEVISQWRILNNQVTTYLRCLTVWSNWWCDNKLSSQLLVSSLSNEYSSTVKEACTKEKSNYDKMVEQLKSITKTPFWMAAIKKWIDEWTKAVSMLYWWEWKISSNEERKMLSKELTRQWVKWDQAKAILGNLDCYNDWNKWLVACTQKRITNMIQPFTTMVQKIYQNYTKEATNTQSVPRLKWLIVNYDAIIKDINTDFENHSTLLMLQNIENDKWIATLIQMHINLIKTNDLLKKSIEIADAACNRQARTLECP